MHHDSHSPRRRPSTTTLAALPLERSNILIVDDRLDKRVVFRTILEELDQNIVTASSGEEALRWLLDNDCAVILLDVNMPGMDGLETAELIRARRKSAHTPIIFITAFADEMHTARGYSLGAVDYILSPVVPNILRSKVKALVQLHRLNAELKKRSDERVALVSEQAARTIAEDSQRRASFLAEATQVMASSLDVETHPQGRLQLLVPFLADYARRGPANEDGAVRAQRSSCRRRLGAIRGQATRGPSSRSRRAQARAITSARAPACASASRCRSPTRRRTSPRARSMLSRWSRAASRAERCCSPLGPSGAASRAQDLSLAENLAGRAASALDNCLLYEEIQQRRPAQERVPGHALARAAQPARPVRAALHMLRTQRREPRTGRAAAGDHGPPGRQMTRLVEDLLDISRITRGVIELRRETLDVGAEVRNAHGVLRRARSRPDSQVSVELPARSPPTSSPTACDCSRSSRT